MKINFHDKWGNCYLLDVVILEYTNGGSAIQLFEKNDPFMTATVWLPGLNADEVAIKDYSENEGILAALIQAGIISDVLYYNESFPICKLISHGK